MATTSFSLGPHWDEFIKAQVASGRYGSASEVVREGLRRLEENTRKFELLKADIESAAKQIDGGNYVEGFDAEDIKRRAVERAKRSAAE